MSISRMAQAYQEYQHWPPPREPAPAWLVQHCERLASRQVTAASGADRAAMAVLAVCIHCGAVVEVGAVVCQGCISRDDAVPSKRIT